MAKTKTTKKKPATKKSSKTSRSSSGTGSKKKTSRKASGGGVKKKVTKKKTVTKKKAATKKSSKSAAKPSAKKTSKKSAAKTTKKKSTKKPITKKKTTVKKSSKKSASKATSESANSTAKASDAAGTDAASKKKTRKKRISAADARKRGRSVAEVASSTEADAQGYVFINGRRVRMISTAGKVIAKKAKVAPVEAAVDDAPSIKSLKTKLTKKQLNYYRDLLITKRAEIVGDLSAMEAAALRSSGGELSHMPIHMADIGSDTYEQDFTLGLAESERQQLREIDDALNRIENRTYGVCQMTGKDIPKARLDAKPWAKYTIEAARVVESQMQR